MNRYIIADLKRIFKKKSHWIIFAILVLFCAIGCIDMGSTPMTGADIIDSLKMDFNYAAVPFGVLSIFYVFADDLKAKTSQIAIGIGISRREVVIAKWLESALMMAIDILLIFIACILTNIVSTTAHPTFGEWIQAAVVAFVAIFQMAAYLSIVMITIYAGHGTTLALLIYVLLSCGLINKAVNYLGYFSVPRALHIPQMSITNLATTCRSRMILGSAAPLQWLGLAIYIVIGIVVTVEIFKHQELEF